MGKVEETGAEVNVEADAEADAKTGIACCRSTRRMRARSSIGGKEVSITTGPAAGGPRRLNTSTATRPAGAARHNRRSGAGDASCCASAERNTKTRPSPAPAANCRRRK